jgi:hypothetical protein
MAVAHARPLGVPLSLRRYRLRKKLLATVILSEAKNLGSFNLNELRRSFLGFTQDRLRLLRMTA